MLRYSRDSSDNIGNAEARDMPLSVNKQMKKMPYMTEEDEEYQDYIHLYAGKLTLFSIQFDIVMITLILIRLCFPFLPSTAQNKQVVCFIG